MGKAISQQIRDQHFYFIVEGSSADVAYEVAKEMGLRVIEFKRLDAAVPGVKEEKEVEYDDPKNPGTLIKRKVKVLADVQPQVYRALGSGKDALERRAKSAHTMETLYVDTFHYVVKAMARPGMVVETETETEAVEPASE